MKREYRFYKRIKNKKERMEFDIQTKEIIVTSYLLPRNNTLFARDERGVPWSMIKIVNTFFRRIVTRVQTGNQDLLVGFWNKQPDLETLESLEQIQTSLFPLFCLARRMYDTNICSSFDDVKTVFDYSIGDLPHILMDVLSLFTFNPNGSRGLSMKEANINFELTDKPEIGIEYADIMMSNRLRIGSSLFIPFLVSKNLFTPNDLISEDILGAPESYQQICAVYHGRGKNIIVSHFDATNIKACYASKIHLFNIRLEPYNDEVKTKYKMNFTVLNASPIFVFSNEHFNKLLIEEWKRLSLD